MGKQDTYIEYVRENLDARTLLEQLAEESAELSQAALKLIRADKLSNNATPISEAEAFKNLKEEFTDVLIVLYAFGEFDIAQAVEDMPQSSKWRRWAKRLWYKEGKEQE